MKNKKIILILILLVVFFDASITHAVARAVFPNSSSLQPLPSTDIRPNISNNVNAQLRANEFETIDEEQINEAKKYENTVPIETENNLKFKLNFGWIISIAMAIGLIILMTVRRLLK